MPLPLEGLLVVALEQAVAAPMCTCRLADAGARVIKIERPEGDFARGYVGAVHGESAYFVWLNRGKIHRARSCEGRRQGAVRCNLSQGRRVQNLKPGALRSSFPIANLRREHPRLIVCSVSSCGEGVRLPCARLTIAGAGGSGLSSVTGRPDTPRASEFRFAISRQA
jgi:crotonobetainyl-CoA:carnitine CoA-transferase CaiB-like acyl-CoA transferase